MAYSADLALTFRRPHESVSRVLADDSRWVIAFTPDRALADVGLWKLALARAVEMATERGGARTLWLTTDVESTVRIASRWLGAVPRGLVSIRRSELVIGEGSIVFRDYTRSWSSPHDSYRLVVIDHAHRADAAVPATVERYARAMNSRVLSIAESTPADHWTRAKVGASEHTIGYEAALTAGILNETDVEAIRGTMSADEFAARMGGELPSERSAEAEVSLRKFAGSRLYILPKGATNYSEFKLFPLQQRYLAMKRLGWRKGFRKFVLLKYRQGGYTTLEQAASYKLCATVRNAKCLTLAQDDENTRVIFGMVNKFHENDPRQPERIGVGNERVLRLVNGSTFSIGTAGSGNLGRGRTINRIHGSEVAFWLHNNAEKIERLLAGLKGAVGDHGEMILESTPNGMNTFRDYYLGAKAGTNGFYPLFLPWFLDPQYRIDGVNHEEIMATLTEEERELVAKVGATWGRVLTPEQIAWRRQAKKLYGRLFVQEFIEDDESCFITSGSCYFDPAAIARLLNATPDYENGSVAGWIYETVPGGYSVQCEPPDQNQKYVAALDASEGAIGSDPCGFGIMNRSTGTMVYWEHGIWRPAELAERAMKACIRYNRAYLGVERNNHGHAVLLALSVLGYDSGDVLYYHEDGRAGWVTDPKTRPLLLSELHEAIMAGSEHGMVIRDRLFMRQCLTFKRQRDGKFEADNGEHDDAVMIWGIAWQMRKFVPEESRVRFF